MSDERSEIWGYPVRLHVGELAIPLALKRATEVLISDRGGRISTREVVVIDFAEMKRRVDDANEKGYGL